MWVGWTDYCHVSVLSCSVDHSPPAPVKPDELVEPPVIEPETELPPADIPPDELELPPPDVVVV